MRFDAGALSPHRKMSSMYRFLSNPKGRPYIRNWPWRWVRELGIFLNTPGVTWAWVSDNLNMEKNTLVRINNLTRDWHWKADENLRTVTETDAVMYLTNARRGSVIPFWAKPFILDDLKRGMTYRQVRNKYHISEEAIRQIRNGVIGNVFHSGPKPRWGKNLGR